METQLVTQLVIVRTDEQQTFVGEMIIDLKSDEMISEPSLNVMGGLMMHKVSPMYAFKWVKFTDRLFSELVAKPEDLGPGPKHQNILIAASSIKQMILLNMEEK